MSRRELEALLHDVYGDDRDAFLVDLRAFSESLESIIQQPVVETLDRSAEPLAISVRNVTRRFRLSRSTGVEALRGVSFDIHRGEVVAIVGASGSGKSTLMNIMGGLDKPTTGSVEVAGTDIAKLGDAKLSQYRRNTIGFIFQFFYLQPFLTLARNVEIPLMFAGTNRRERKARVAEALRQVGLSDQSLQRPSELSGGQIQRAAIARALINNPSLILADEPTGNLDSVNAFQIVDALKRLRDDLGTTVVIITHDPAVAAAADRRITLKDGEVVS